MLSQKLNQNEEIDPIIFQLTRLQEELQKILDDNSLPVDVKCLKYNNVLSRYLNLKEQQNQDGSVKSSAVPIAAAVTGVASAANSVAPDSVGRASDSVGRALASVGQALASVGRQNNAADAASIAAAATPPSLENSLSQTPSTLQTPVNRQTPPSATRLPDFSTFIHRNQPAKKQQKARELAEFVNNNSDIVEFDKHFRLILNGRPVIASDIRKLINDFSYDKVKSRTVAGAEEF